MRVLTRRRGRLAPWQGYRGRPGRNRRSGVRGRLAIGSGCLAPRDGREAKLWGLPGCRDAEPGRPQRSGIGSRSVCPVPAASTRTRPGRTSASDAALEALISLRLAEALWHVGQVDEARDAVTRALTLARQRGERGNEAEALRLLGEVAVGTGPAVRGNADVDLRAALALAAELGMRPLVAHCHLGLGTMYRRTADHAKASGPLNAATTLYREMDMRFWREKAEAASLEG
jgi:hypothetical protein